MSKQKGWLRLSSKSSFAGAPEDQDAYISKCLLEEVLRGPWYSYIEQVQDGWVLIHGAEVGCEAKFSSRAISIILDAFLSAFFSSVMKL